MFMLRDVYPAYQGLETTERTIPIEQYRKDPFVKEDVGFATPQEKRNIWIGFIVLVVLLIVFALVGNTK